MMKHIRTALFLLACLAVGVGIGKVIQYFRHPKTEETPAVLTGAGRRPPFRGFIVDAPSNPSEIPDVSALVATLAHCHATALAVRYPRDGNTDALVQLITQCRSFHEGKKLSFILLPPAVPESSTRNPYPVPLAQAAKLAQQLQIDFLVVSWLSADPDEDWWVKQLVAVRTVYEGHLILAADQKLLPDIELWDSVDYVAAFGQFPITTKTEPTVHDLRAGWASNLDSLESLARRRGKALFLLDAVAAPAAAHTSSPHQSANKKKNPTDPVLDQYQALLLETKGRANTDGLFFPAAEFGQAPAPSSTTIHHRPEILALFASTWASESGSDPVSTSSSSEPTPEEPEP